MTFLLVGYCFFIDGQEPAIGVYKRLLRIGVELARRGHRVHVHVTGRERYNDPLVEEAGKSLSFVDLKLKVGGSQEAADTNLEVYRECIDSLAADLVLIGEVPLCGNMLEATLAAAQCGVPAVIVDNAYSPRSVKYFVVHHGPAADGLLFVGPSSHELQPAPSHVGYAAPFIPAQAELATPVVGGIGEDGPAITILGYDPAVRRLGLELLRELGPGCGQAVVISPDPEGTAELAASLSLGPGDVVAVPPPPEKLLFALVAASKLAVVKGGFMQVTECLCLGTPVVAYHYGGSFPVGWIPPGSQRFIVSCREPRPNAAVVHGARRFLRGGAGTVAVHDGPLAGIAASASYLEDIAARPLRTTTTSDSSRAGLSPEAVTNALRKRFGPANVELTSLRCTRTRHYDSFDIYAAIARASVGGVDLAPALVGWVFRTAADAALRSSALTPERQDAAHLEDRVIIEPWLGENLLPEREWDLGRLKVRDTVGSGAR